MPHLTYILYSEDLDKFYIGSTSSTMEERLDKHLTDHKGYTGKAKDWEVKYLEEFPTVNEARKREREIKKWKSRKQIVRLIGTD